MVGVPLYRNIHTMRIAIHGTSQFAAQFDIGWLSVLVGGTAKNGIHKKPE